jgi:hypothetical protein
VPIVLAGSLMFVQRQTDTALAGRISIMTDLLRCSSATKIGNSILLYSRAWAWRTKRKGPVRTGKNEVWTTSSSLALRRIGKGRDDAPTMPIKKSIAGSLLPGALDTMATRLGETASLL